MRIGLPAVGVVVALMLAVLLAPDRDVVLPRVGPRVEDLCVQAMTRSPPDHSWGLEWHQDRDIRDVQLGELTSHLGEVVRVAGVLHAEYEWVALYPSRAAMEDAPTRWPWVDLTSLDLKEPAWSSISDRCVVLEGRYRSGPAGHFRTFNGYIDVRRLEVWAAPHRRYVTAPIPPPPPLLPPRRLH